MDESAGKSPGEGENAENNNAENNKVAQSAANQNQAESKAADSKLPVVWSPKLDAGEAAADDLLDADADAATESAADAPKDEPGEPPSEPANDAALPRSLRFAMLAASLAAAAALGSFAGSLSATGVAHFWPAGTANATLAVHGAPQSAKAEIAELSALKSNLDGASRSTNSQLAKLAERLDRIERAQAEPAAKLAHMADAIDRLEKKSVAASIAAAAPETTGTISAGPPEPAGETKPPENVLRDWIVREVHGNRALVGNRYGGIFDITTGSVLPGLGRIESIKRQDGQWIVVTARGLIYSAP
jgi:hypothetical protein